MKAIIIIVVAMLAIVIVQYGVVTSYSIVIYADDNNCIGLFNMLNICKCPV